MPVPSKEITGLVGLKEDRSEESGATLMSVWATDGIEHLGVGTEGSVLSTSESHTMTVRSNAAEALCSEGQRDPLLSRVREGTGEGRSEDAGEKETSGDT